MQLEELQETGMVLALEIAAPENSVTITLHVLQHVRNPRAVHKWLEMVEPKEIVRTRMNFAMRLEVVAVYNIINIVPNIGD